MEKRQATDIDRKLAIYYHPLFQEVIKNMLLLFGIPEGEPFEIGLLEFVEFNLKLQKSLLPSFETENALVSALNDWVKEVAECLSYEGMVSTAHCEEITAQNFAGLLEREAAGMRVAGWTGREEQVRVLLRLGSHDAFKLLGVRINKEVFNKFMFDLCSTWCEFLDIELFTYFLLAIYVQLSQGESLARSAFRPNAAIAPIDLEFMEEFEEIKAQYSKTRKKDLRYYRAWCEWNYLRINEVGEALILHLDHLHPQDPRILELALIFEKAIQVINDEITNQNHPPALAEQPQPPLPPQDNKDAEFLVAKKIGAPVEREKRASEGREREGEGKTQEVEEVAGEDEEAHNFEIEIDAEGNMYLRKIVRMPVLGTRIELEPHERRALLRLQYMERKREEIRRVSNLYRRMENMKVRLEHNPRHDPYAFRALPRLADRDHFYAQQPPPKEPSQYTNLPVDKIIHGKPQPPPEPPAPAKDREEYKQLFKPELLAEREPIRKNEDYIHKVIAPPFLTDHRHNPAYSQHEASVYGVGPYAERRDLKLGLPKLQHLGARVDPARGYHLVGKLTRDRNAINDRVKSLSATQPEASRLEREREEYRHVWARYISEEEMGELTDYQAFYGRLEAAKRRFSQDHQSEYRLNLKQILLYEDRRYEMGGAIDRLQQDQFYDRIRKLIRRDHRRHQKRQRKARLRSYRQAVGPRNDPNRQLFEDIFLGYHRAAISSLRRPPPQLPKDPLSKELSASIPRQEASVLSGK